MFHHTPIHTLKRRWKLLLIAGLAVSAFSLIATLFFPLEYRADAQVLIISKSRYGIDPYTVVKSAERVGENVKEIMTTNDFYDKVINHAGFGLDTSQFDALTERKKRKLWKKTIQSSVVYGTGVLNISAYHEDPEQAFAYADAAADTLAAKGWEYVGGDVTIKVVNRPVVTRFPARPNLPINLVAGFIVGMFGMGVLVLRQ